MTAAGAVRAAAPNEAALAARWAEAPSGPLRLEDGRALRIIFPGVPGGASGPDFRDAILDAGGDLLRGDVEIHLQSSGWRQHGHAHDPAYANVVLHVVAENDTGAAATLHGSGRAIAVLVLRLEQGAFPPPFTPPCAVATRKGLESDAVLARMGLRRLRAKAARAAPLVAAGGAGNALYALLLETLGGPANRAAFAQIARMLPLPGLLERADTAGVERALAMSAELKGAAAGLVVRRAGLRPMAAPGRRLEAAGALFARLWAAGAGPGWPEELPAERLPAALKVPGIGRAMAIELAVNAVLPVALGAGAWPEARIEQAFAGLPSPGTYGKLRRLEGWLSADGTRPFGGAQRLQGGLLLHTDYCTKGACGRCPLSSGM